MTTAVRAGALSWITLLGGLLLLGCGDASNSTVTSGVRPPTTPPPSASASATPDHLIDAAKRSLLRVRNTGCGELSTGSAFLGPDGVLFTNRHVAEGSRELDLLTWDGIDLRATQIEVSDGLDVARLTGDWSPAPDLTPLPVRRNRVEPGERIAIIGFPEGDQLALATGVATRYGPDPATPEHDVLKVTTIVKPGNSGGPALDMRGNVVGIVYAEEVATDEALIVPIDAVLAMDASDFRPEPPCG
jgi:S1-C subfamily serine protease